MVNGDRCGLGLVGVLEIMIEEKECSALTIRIEGILEGVLVAYLYIRKCQLQNKCRMGGPRAKLENHLISIPDFNMFDQGSGDI